MCSSKGRLAYQTYSVRMVGRGLRMATGQSTVQSSLNQSQTQEYYVSDTIYNADIMIHDTGLYKYTLSLACKETVHGCPIELAKSN